MNPMVSFLFAFPGMILLQLALCRWRVPPLLRLVPLLLLTVHSWLALYATADAGLSSQAGIILLIYWLFSQGLRFACGLGWMAAALVERCRR